MDGVRKQMHAEERAAFEAALKAEVLKLTAQFNHARKLQEREHNNVLAELAIVGAQAQRERHQMGSERRSWQMEASRAAERIESLERDLALAYAANSASGKAESRDRTTRFWVMGAVLTVAVVLAFVFC
jgi:hypothetical protein